MFILKLQEQKIKRNFKVINSRGFHTTIVLYTKRDSDISRFKMEKFQLPKQIMKDLKCNLCCEYLSYPPITLHADTGSVCGRCPALEAERNITPLRETNYERIVRNLVLFPCRYQPQGCEGLFTIDEIPVHECICSAKPFFCPAMPLGCCPWQGAPSESQMHFATEHHELYMQSNVFELDLVNTYSINMLMTQFDTLFLLRKEYNEDTGMFFCGIYQVNNYEQLKFEYLLEFKSGDGQKKFRVQEKNVPIFQNDVLKEDCFKINAPVIRDTLNSPMMITCTVDITEGFMEELECSNEQIEADIIDDLNEESQEVIKIEDDKMLLDLECPVCQEFMIPPIYQCQIGHSVCGTCKPSLRDCPSCRGPIGETRNWTLEKLTEHIMYQCKNRLDGCAYRANCKEIKNHEAECKFSPVKCPLTDLLECPWKGLNKTIISHIKMEHSHHLNFEPLIIKSHYIDEEMHDEQRITKVFGEVFRLRLGYNYEKKKFYTTVQFIGPNEDAKKFMYEIRLVDLKTKCLQATIKKFCGGINEKKNDIAHCTVLPLDLALQFLSEENMFEVHYKITKV